MDESIGRTVLHDWHESHGGKMIAFSGFEMPVQYSTGIIAEHLATRRHAGLFDVSHMGRFRVRGPEAETFLQRMLTNSAAGLPPLEAHYTFLANEQGGAVDDAYLYRLGVEDFLLVVNAGNRDIDLEWLRSHLPAHGVSLDDESESVAMFALQGPSAAEALAQVVDARVLPENKRNRISITPFEGHPLVISRTGYTGESGCFEIFPASDVAGALWDLLVEAGATPAGLGARDSLRLEAGLPLYGHELGIGPDGRDIPLFSNAIARFAVRAGGAEDFIGRSALQAQRAEYELIRRGELKTPPAERLLTHLVQPLAVFEGRRPLRQGWRIVFAGEEVGWVSSGTMVPYPIFQGDGLMARPGEQHAMRPIGLALLRSDLHPASDRPLHVEVHDDRGNVMEAQIVERNFWPVSPYGRPFGGFEAPADPAEPVPLSRAQSAALQLRESAADNHRWRRIDCINLIPSENCTSAFVEELSISDPVGRYNEHNHLRALGVNSEEVRYYKGTAYSMEKEIELIAALRSFFGCRGAEVRVISGQMANDTVYDALKQFRNRHRPRRTAAPLRRVLVHDLNKGGHLSAQFGGALKNYVAHDPQTERPAVDHFPAQPERPYRIDAEAACALIGKGRPDLVIFGRSVILHPEPVAEIVAYIHREFGADNPERPLVMYDGAHVLGLLGPHFQDPIAEGADIVTGSTHKTFFGPQRGVILTSIGPGHVFEGLWRFVASRTFPGHVSNHHPGTLLGLLGATLEMLHFRNEYQPQVVANARAFARALAEAGLGVEGDEQSGYTDTHQVLIRGARGSGNDMADRLESANIITNPQAFYDDPSFAASSGVRLGTQEMTRFGMNEADFEALAPLVAKVILDRDSPPEAWRDEVIAFRRNFLQMRYHL